ncbi:MAG: flagellar protein FlaG, partial [Clostridia bacterium]|nr:flagellar protein FlaG [Clostridia bacterium]
MMDQLLEAVAGIAGVTRHSPSVEPVTPATVQREGVSGADLGRHDPAREKPADRTGRVDGDDGQGDSALLDAEEVQRAVDKLNVAVQLFNHHVQFTVFEQGGRLVVQLVDVRGNRVIYT